MRTQPRVLALFARRADRSLSVTFQDVARELGITDRAAVDCLERLWRLRLVAPVGGRRHGFKSRPEPGERIHHLRFRLTDRGEERRRWWDRQNRGRDRGFLA
jgi:hypothetical protein